MRVTQPPSGPLHVIQNKLDLENLFGEAADDLARYFSRRHGSDSETSQDLVQETFLEMAKRIAKGGEFRSPRAYLFGIARHVSLAAWSLRDSHRALVTEISASAEESDVENVRLVAVQEVIAALPTLHREILELRFTQNLSYAEIAEALAIPLGTVRSRLHHALASVRERLAEDESPMIL